MVQVTPYIPAIVLFAAALTLTVAAAIAAFTLRAISDLYKTTPHQPFVRQPRLPKMPPLTAAARDKAAWQAEEDAFYKRSTPEDDI